jgi:methionyl-tRNA formyltransferase
MEIQYIVASCKRWHKFKFDAIEVQSKGNWHWVETPAELDECLSRISKPRYIFFLHWNWRVPDCVWQHNECVCFHMTDVPFGRGGSPLQNLIVAGHKTTKISALRMVAELDAGPVYCKYDLTLEGRAIDIYLRASDISFNIIQWITRNEPWPVAQQGEPVVFFRRRPSQSALPMTGNLEALYDHIRMLDAPTYPLAFLEHGSFRIEFSEAEFNETELVARVVVRKIDDRTNCK